MYLVCMYGYDMYCTYDCTVLYIHIFVEYFIILCNMYLLLSIIVQVRTDSTDTLTLPYVTIMP